MSLGDFVNKYTGQSVPNNGGGFLGECVSLAARYAQEVQGIPGADGVLYCSNTGGARDLYEQFDGKLPNYYDRIPYGQPRQRGDLVVWGANLGKYGDVAIALDGGTQVFGQLGTPVFLPANVRIENRQPLGYLRKKGSPVDIMNEEQVKSLYEVYWRTPPSAEEIQFYTGKPATDLIDPLRSSARKAEVDGIYNVGVTANRDNWSGQISSLEQQVKDAQGDAKPLDKGKYLVK